MDYLNLDRIEENNAPAYRESGIFIIRGGHFSSAYPWTLVFLANRIDKQTGTRTFASFDKTYWLPARYLVGGHPVVERPSPWLSVWKGKKIGIVIFGFLLAAAALIYGLRGKRVRRPRQAGR